MPQIKPFKALMYNQEKVKDLSKVVCPPYDVISPVDSNYYHDISPYNFVRLELGKKVPGEDKYKRAKDYLRDWLKEETLIRDEKPCIYFCSQQYSLKGVKKERLGFFSLLHLGDHKRSSVYSHEHTRLEPKEDRFRLIKKVKANLSPIFLVFPDAKRIVQRTYQLHVQGKPPFLEVTDKDKVTHRLWRLDAPDVVSGMQACMQKENIFIADGHHRYEVALAFRDLMKKKKQDTFTGVESFNYVLAYFTHAPSHGLCVLPVHRLVKTRSKFDYATFIQKLKENFYVEEKIADKTQLFFLMEKGGRTEHVLGMYKDGKYHLLRLKNIGILEKTAAGRSKEFRSLDVSILNNLILKSILKLDIEDKKNILYSPHADEFIEKVDRSSGVIAFLLNPAKIEEVIAVALNGERMPSKTTYFYPKVLSGLLIHKFE